MDQLESFETKRFVQRLLGKGDVNGLMGKIQEAIPEDKQPELLDTINKVGVVLAHLQQSMSSKKKNVAHELKCSQSTEDKQPEV